MKKNKIRQLEKDGFIVDEDNTLTYEFSDFEMLSAYVEQVTVHSGKQMLKIDMLRIYNPTDETEAYVNVGYELYFETVKEFYVLLGLLGYPMIVKNV